MQARVLLPQDEHLYALRQIPGSHDVSCLVCSENVTQCEHHPLSMSRSSHFREANMRSALPRGLGGLLADESWLCKPAKSIRSHSWRNGSAAACTVRDKDEEAEAATDERDEGVQSTCCFGWIQRLQLSRGPVPGLLAAAHPSAESGDSVERA